MRGLMEVYLCEGQHRLPSKTPRGQCQPRYQRERRGRQEHARPSRPEAGRVLPPRPKKIAISVMYAPSGPEPAECRASGMLEPTSGKVYKDYH